MELLAVLKAPTMDEEINKVQMYITSLEKDALSLMGKFQYQNGIE